MPIFRFSQVETPWPLGPPDGRYLVRTWDDGPGSAPTHVLVLATVGARRRGRLTRTRRDARPEPEPAAVITGRATVIAAAPFDDAASAAQWLGEAGEQDLSDDLRALDKVLHAFRVVTCDPHQRTIAREELLTARVGYGEGEQVAYGRWTQAHELVLRGQGRSRSKVLEPQARLAQVLGQRVPLLICEELVLRGRLDWDCGREREAALQMKVACEAALSELSPDEGQDMSARLAELAELAGAVQAAAGSALVGHLSDHERETVERSLGRLEAALRARAVALA